MPHFWDDKFWDPRVHLHFSEKLHFFLVKTKPFRPDEIVRRLDQINRDLKLGSVRTFKILGLYDLLIWAWLHPNTETAFAEHLMRLPNYKSHFPFTVESVVSRWYSANGQAGPAARHSQLLADLDLNHEKLEAIESGNEPAAYEDYKTHGLAVERVPSDAITFFIGVNFDDAPDEDGLTAIIRRLVEYIGKDLTGLKRVIVSKGIGFCRILIKGESRDFFEIGKLPGWAHMQ